MNILYIMSSYNIYTGTPKKTLDLLQDIKKNGAIYFYHDSYCDEFKDSFARTGAQIHEGVYGRNLYFHIRKLLVIIDNEKIDIVQTQFSMGETLGYLIKFFRPHVKLIVVFEGSYAPSKAKKILQNYFYKKVDKFVYISKFVQKEKEKQFPILSKKETVVILNGAVKRKIDMNNKICMSYPTLLCVSSLTEIKNISILIEAIKIWKCKDRSIYLYIAGEGVERARLEKKISQYGLEKEVFLLGNQKNIGYLLEQADIYLHPAYAEGFGIAVVEAMLAGKPVIAANAGALPELIDDGKTGILVDPFDAQAWAEAILTLLKDKEMAESLGRNAKIKAQNEFTTRQYVFKYRALYGDLIADKKNKVLPIVKTKNREN